MNRSIITCIFGLLFLFPAFSQSSVWKIAGEGFVLFLGGSIHLLREQDASVWF